MHISQIPDLIKVADVVEHPSFNKMVKFRFVCSKHDKKNPANRVYILTADGEVRKIGGSAADKGIQGTLGSYENGFSGTPDGSGRTVGVPLYLLAEIRAGRKVEVWMQFTPTVTADLPSLTGGTVRGEVSVGYKDIEPLWIEQYKAIEGDLPLWNLQERREKWLAEVRHALNWFRAKSEAGVTPSGKKGKREYTQDERDELVYLIEAAVNAYTRLHP